MTKLETLGLTSVFTVAVLGLAWADNSVTVPELGVNTKVDAVIGIELNVGGGEAKLINFDLQNGANAMLHGYVPKMGEVVEWYVRSADCIEPGKKCVFDLAIRKGK